MGRVIDLVLVLMALHQPLETETSNNKILASLYTVYTNLEIKVVPLIFVFGIKSVKDIQY